jgi:uncharacterized membrane protein YdjX (TVP38/TMEM64 family)
MEAIGMKPDRARTIVPLAVAVAALIGISLAWSLLPLRDWTSNASALSISLGMWGPVAFLLAYVVAVTALVPASVPTLAAGLIFGFWGFPLSLIAATGGAACSFMIAKHLARDRVRLLVDDRPKSRAVYRAVSEGGWKIVWLLRLIPVMPFSLLNYALGVTQLGFQTYLTATAVGIIPSIALYVYLGALGRAAIDGTVAGMLRWVLLILGLAATIVVIWYIGRKARDELQKAGVETR